jgi:phage gp29-like protein
MPILNADGEWVTMGKDGKVVTQEIATVDRDIHRVWYGNVLRNEDSTLLTRGAAKGLLIYDELKRDAHAGAVLAKRKLAVTSRPWKVDPASDAAADKAAAELVRKALEHLRFNNLCKRLLEATLKGYSVAETLWELRDGAVLPARVKAKDPRRFVFDKAERLRLLTPDARLEGIELPPRKFIVHRRGADDDSPYGTGIGGMLFWPVFFKRNGITFWLTFADKFGNPTPVGKYPNGAGAPEQKKLLDALRSLAQDTGVIIPEGMVIELLEAQRSGTVDTYEKLVRYMDEQISKAVLGETMSTEELKEMLERAASNGDEITFEDFYFIMTKKTFA